MDGCGEMVLVMIEQISGQSKLLVRMLLGIIDAKNPVTSFQITLRKLKC